MSKMPCKIGVDSVCFFRYPISVSHTVARPSTLSHAGKGREQLVNSARDMDPEDYQYITRRSQLNFDDKTLKCRECGNDFVFTAGEQEFYQQKGLMNQPSRCASCRATRRNASSGRAERAPREMHPVICAECGAETQVPFLPKNDRPVYCSTCYDKARVARN